MGQFDDLIPGNAGSKTGVFDDLVPVKREAGSVSAGSGAFDDLVPEGNRPRADGKDRFGSEMRQAAPEGAVKRVYRKVREALAPVIGPTEEQRDRDSVLIDGELVYKPLGDLVAKEGLVAGLSRPGIEIPRMKAQADDGKAEAIAKAVGNTAIGFGEFAESPLGMLTAGASMLTQAPKLGQAIAGGYALDMASKTPEMARAAGEASVNGNTQEQAETLLQLGVNAFLVPGLGKHAVLDAVESRTRPKDFVVRKLSEQLRSGAMDFNRGGAETRREEKETVSEFGGEQELEAAKTKAPPVGVFDDLVAEAAESKRVDAAQERLAGTLAPPIEEPVQTSVIADKQMHPVVEVPLKELQLSKDVPNFKAEADPETGVVAGQKLEGKYERLGTGAITVWERADGSKEVISGRHRFDLARRAGEETIPAQIVREADGFTADMAMTLDAEMNIRDGQGSVGDYANYFRHAQITPEEAAARGLVARAKGKAGWTIGKNLSDDAFAIYRAGKISEGQAVAIGNAAPGEAALQRVGVKAALEGKNPQELANFIQAVKLETKSMPAEQFDLFAADDSALKEAERLASVASRIQTELSREIKATDNAAKAATTARAKGIAFEKPPEQILAENAELKAERDRWDNWALHKDLVDQVRGYAEMDRAQGAKPSLESRLDRLKIDTRGQLHAFGLIPETWNTLIDLVKLGVRGGRAAADAVSWALEQFKLKNPGLKFDEAGAQAHLLEKFANGDRRQFGEKVVASADISPEVTAGVNEYTYEPRSNATDLQEAQRIIQQRGVDGAVAIYKRPPVGMPGAVQSALGKALILEMAKAEKIARATGNKIEADALVEKQIDLIDADLKRSTDVAQSLQAMRLFGDMSPTAVVRHAERTMAEAGAQERQRVQPHVEGIKEEMRQANESAVEQIRTDGEVNRVARAAVDEVIAQSPEVHKGIVMELAEPFAQSPTILQHARTAVAAKVNELLNTQPRPPGMTISQHQRAIMNELAQRAASIANGHYQGAEPGVTLTQKLQQRLGISGEHAGRLAKQLDAEFAKMVEKAKGKLSQRIANQRARQQAGEVYNPENVSDAAVEREIRRQLRDLNLKLGDVVRRAGAEVDATGATIGEKVVRASGLTGEKADALREVFDRRWKAIATEAKRRRLESMERNIGKPPRRVREQYEKIIELTNLGAFDNARFENVLLEKMDLPTVTPEMRREIVRRANELATKPEGFQRQRATIELLDYIAKQRGMKWWDLPMAFWYANVLSGPTTHLVNGVSNAFNLTTNLGIQMARHPLATPEILSALGRGLGKGVLEGAEVLRSGLVTGTRFTKFEESRPLELVKFEGIAKPLNAWKYVTRALSAEDMLFFKAAEEMKSAVAARIIAKREGLSGDGLQKRVDDLLGNVEARVAAAKVQAHAEGLTGLDLRRRVNEILEQGRPDAMRMDAKDYALQVTFNGKPYGLIGAIAEAINYAHQKTVVTRFAVPFTNIVSNVVNEGLNYVPPVGVGRAIWGHMKGELHGKLADREALYDQWTKAALGTALLTGLAIATAETLDDEDPAFAIYGEGPRTKDQRNQLKAGGWIPNSVKVGKRYYSFANTPAAIPLAIMGNYFDAVRFKSLDETDALNRAAYAFLQGGHVILQSSFLDSLARLFEVANRDSTKKSGAHLAEFAGRTAGSFVIPNALKQVDRIFDPTVYDSADVEAGVINQIPFVRKLNKAALNVFGEPVQTYVSSRFTSEQKVDPVLKMLAKKKVFISVPDRQDVTIGKKKLGAGYYRVLTPDEFYDFTKESGQAIRKQLTERQAQIEAMEPTQAKAFVERIVDLERAKAKKRFSL